MRPRLAQPAPSPACDLFAVVHHDGDGPPLRSEQGSRQDKKDKRGTGSENQDDANGEADHGATDHEDSFGGSWSAVFG